MTADEAMNLQDHEALLWADGLVRPGLINRAPYFKRAEMAGRYLLYLEAEPLFSLGGFPVSIPYLTDGLLFGGSLLAFLTVHEFGQVTLKVTVPPRVRPRGAN